MKTQTKRPWTRGDKLLVIIPAAFTVAALGLFFWLKAANTLPAPLPPPHPMPAVNARDYYIAATNALVDNSKIEWANSRWVPGTKTTNPDQHFYSLAAKEKLVAENTPALSLLHQGFQYPYEEPPVRSFYTPLPHYQHIRQLARFLSLDGQVKAAQGNWAGAVSAELDAVQMGETLPHGGPLIGMLVGAACQNIGRKHIWAAVPHLSGPEAQAAERRLEAIRTAHVSFADTMQEEKWGTQASLRELMSRPNWSQTLAPAINGTTSANSPMWAQQGFSAYLQMLGKRRILETNAQWMDKAIAQSRQPYAAHPAMPPLPKDLVSQILLPAYGKVRLNEVSSDTQNALLVTTLALQAYHQDHNTYPATLAALVPGYLKAVPTDPFGLSGPLRYKLAGKKYVLYSIGPDSKDDGGRAIFDTTQLVPGPGKTSDQRRFVEEGSRGDVVAGVNVI